MDKPCQRKGAKSNTYVGKEFERKTRKFFTEKGLDLQEDVSIQIGINGTKAHNFDLGRSPLITQKNDSKGNTLMLNLKGLSEVAMVAFLPMSLWMGKTLTLNSSDSRLFWLRR